MLGSGLVSRELDGLLDLRHALPKRTKTDRLARSSTRRQVHVQYQVRDHPEMTLQILGQRRELPPNIVHVHTGRLVALQRECVLLDDPVDALEQKQRVVQRLDLRRARRVESKSSHHFTRSRRGFSLSFRPAFACGFPFTCTMSAVKSNRPSNNAAPTP